MPEFARDEKGHVRTRIYNVHNNQTGTTDQRVATTTAPTSISEACALIEREPENSELRRYYQTETTRVVGVIRDRALTQALEFGARSMHELGVAKRATTDHGAAVAAAIEALRTGEMTPEAGADLYDRVIREQRAISGQVSAWRTGAQHRMDVLKNPVAAYERMLTKFPIQRSKTLF